MNTDHYEIYLCLYAYVCGLRKTWLRYYIEFGISIFTTTTDNPFAFFSGKASLANIPTSPQYPYYYLYLDVGCVALTTMHLKWLTVR
ncbi:hypothetical protein IQ229_06585 [Nostoc cf. edaphicum LEGE 07299]|uniref:Uncharacterized protein n=1 Tax=Nostoc cf. edaphicum LEGE 07299 TaxID=2777974 RepID=A0ABR9TX01_9NOSO|nr:hypothetical protein [Nostoc cf. edaphicum LEGE 07299]